MPRTFDPQKYRQSLVDSHAGAVKAAEKVQARIDGTDEKPGLKTKAEKANQVLEEAKTELRAAQGRVAQAKQFLDAHDTVAGRPAVDAVLTEANGTGKFDGLTGADALVATGRPVKDQPQA
jgi:nucleotide-binding universal stress UspA family protein